MNDIDKTTIVSACDQKFLWGAFLLASSAARFLPDMTVHILQTGFSEEDIKLISQFPCVKVLPFSDNDPRNINNRKAEAILSATTEFVAWLDADCMVIGGIAPLLIPENGEFQIRMREPWENAWVWRNHYAPGETRGGIPATVLEHWRDDVGQLQDPQANTTCVTNAFVLHRRHFDFIHEWKAQIAKVIPAKHAGVVDRGSPAYFMTDESVLSSLLAFSKSAPAIGEMRLNRDPNAHVAHFGANPKPWKRWRALTWYCNRHILDLLDWVRETGRATPPVPWSFERKNRLPAYLLAQTCEAWNRVRAVGGKLKGRFNR